MNYIDKDALTRADTLRRETVSIDGIGDVRMRELSVGDRMTVIDRYSSLQESADRDTTIALALVAMSLCAPDDSPMFGPDELDAAIEMLSGKSQRVIEEMQAAFLKLSGLSDDDVKDAVGNSIGITSDGGSTGSPVISDIRQPERSAVS